MTALRVSYRQGSSEYILQPPLPISSEDGKILSIQLKKCSRRQESNMEADWILADVQEKIRRERLREGDDLNKGGVKFDAGKTMVELLPVRVLLGWADILTHGASKYAPRNWERGMEWSRPFGAALRHLFKWWMGEINDPDSGKPHLDHAICNLGFLSHYEKTGVGTDDRPR
jgi:hypothetical protein